MSKRPKWNKAMRGEILEAQGYKCAYCGEPIEKAGSELHHDYKGHNWAVVRNIATGVEMRSLGFEGGALSALLHNLYHDRGSVQAMHPKCHIQADTAQQQGIIAHAQRAKA